MKIFNKLFTNTKRLLLISIISILAISASALDLGFIEDVTKGIDIVVNNKDAFAEFDEPKEIELGQNMSSQLLGAAPLVNDPELQQYVNKIGMWLVSQTERPNLPWRFGVLDDNTINAFAAPGGYVFISKGLFMLFRDESELAGVLAHEIGHVIVQHHLEDIKERARNGLMKDIAGEVISQKFGRGWGTLVNQLTTLGVDVWESGLNRDDEFEADQVGVVIAARAGYDPYGLMGVLDTLNRINPSTSESYKQMHATHPEPNARIQTLDAQMSGRMDAYLSNPVDSARLYQFQNKLEKQG